MKSLEEQIKAIPRRIEYLSGQQYSYIPLEEVLAVLENSKPVGRLTVSQGKTINDCILYETELPDGEYRLLPVHTKNFSW